MEEELLKGKEYVEIEVDPALFPLDVVHRTVYDLQEKAYFIVSDPGTGKFKVTIVKKREDPKEVALEFLTLLSVNSAIRRNEIETQRLKEILSASLLISNSRNLLPGPGGAKGGKGGRKDAGERGKK